VATVRVPVADLRSQPNSIARPGVHDDLQETQLVFGEHVRIRGEQDGWVNVEALEQPEFSHNQRWEGYPGWLQAFALDRHAILATPTVVVINRWARLRREPAESGALALVIKPLEMQVPMGTLLAAEFNASSVSDEWLVHLPNGASAWVRRADVRTLQTAQAFSIQNKRAAILRSAEQLLGDPYYWGGRSPREASIPTSGLDCSGLVGLAYRTVHHILPRDAHEQSMRAQPVSQPQAADLVFLSAREDPKRIVHVMLAAGDDTLIEAPGTGFTVRKITAKERLGRPLSSIPFGAVINGQTITFGSFLAGEQNPPS